MVKIQSVKTANGFQFSIVEGKDEILKANVHVALPRLVSIEFDVFFDMETAWGLGTAKQEIARIFGIANDMDYMFVDENGTEIRPIVRVPSENAREVVDSVRVFNKLTGDEDYSALGQALDKASKYGVDK